jgi:ubiquitin-protein ligase
MEHIAKIISNEKEFILTSKVTILGKTDHVYENQTYDGKKKVNLEFLNMYEVDREEVNKISILDHNNVKVSRNACAIIFKDKYNIIT